MAKKPPADQPAPATRPRAANAAKKAEAAKRQKITFIIDGTAYPLYPDAVTVRQELELHVQTGLNIIEALNPPGGLWSRPFIACIVWLSLKAQGKRLSWDEAAALVPFTGEVELIYGEPDDDAEGAEVDPKAASDTD